MIVALSNLTVAPIDDNYDDKVWIVWGGINTGKKVCGTYLKAAIAWNSYYILMTTGNTWETSDLYVSFFDSGFRLLDFAYLECLAPLAPKFRLIELVQPDCVVVEYGCSWQIRCLPKKRYRLPWITEPGDVTRPKPFSCHFLASHSQKMLARTE